MIIEAEDQGQTDIKGAAEAIKDYLLGVGIKINIKYMDPQSVKSIIYKNKEFDMFLSAWEFDQLNNVRSLFHSEGTYNYISFKKPEVDKYFNFISTTKDDERKRAAHYELHKIFQMECPYVFLWTLERYAAIKKEVGGSEHIHPYRFFTYIRKWYIPKDYQ